jgi:hypothetical protein
LLASVVWLVCLPPCLSVFRREILIPVIAPNNRPASPRAFADCCHASSRRPKCCAVTTGVSYEKPNLISASLLLTRCAIARGQRPLRRPCWILSLQRELRSEESVPTKIVKQTEDQEPNEQGVGAHKFLRETNQWMRSARGAQTPFFPLSFDFEWALGLLMLTYISPKTASAVSEGLKNYISWTYIAL